MRSDELWHPFAGAVPPSGDLCRHDFKGGKRGNLPVMQPTKFHLAATVLYSWLRVTADLGRCIFPAYTIGVDTHRGTSVLFSTTTPVAERFYSPRVPLTAGKPP